jgi:uncharacterized protein involved in tolerance to divalent cations
MKPIAVVTTVANRKEAHRLARALVESTIRDLHSYELPAIHAFAFEHVFPAYAAWIAENAGA